MTKKTGIFPINNTVVVKDNQTIVIGGLTHW